MGFLLCTAGPMKAYIRLVSLVASLALATSCGAKKEHPGKSIGIEAYPGVRDLYQFAESKRQKHGLPALGVGFVRDGRIIGLGVAGERALGTGNWATVDDRFNVASCAKSFTATAAAMLVEKGVVRWDMTIKEVFPDLKRSMLPVYSDVTLEMLLRHRSGLESWMSLNERWKKWRSDHAKLTARESRRAFTAKVLQDRPRHAPGAEFYYCNDGYLVAASMIEEVSGKAWEEIVHALLFEPLGLRSMRYGFPPANETAVVSGHGTASFFWSRTVPVRHEPEKYGDPPFGSPGGTLFTSVADLLRYLDFHIQGANGNSTLLGRDSFERLYTPLESEGYGLGWSVEIKRDRQGKIVERSIFHGGSSGGDRANMWFCPESRRGTVIVYNHGADDKLDAYREIFYALLREFEPRGSKP
jgi:CubicO group peptidase (beta-lactamase class C family)